MAHDELELGEEPADLVDPLDVLRRHRQARPGHAAADADRDVELDRLRVDRVEALVVDRHLRAQPRRERGQRLDAEAVVQRDDLAHLVHAVVRVHLVAGEEALGVLLQRALRGVGVLVDVQHRALDPVLVHLRDDELQHVRARREARDVPEHVLGRHLELLAALAVAEQRLHELVPAAGVVGRDREHQVDDTDPGRHGHHAAPSFAIMPRAAVRLTSLAAARYALAALACEPRSGRPSLAPRIAYSRSRWDHSTDCGFWRSRASARDRSARCCSPTWAPRCCASSASRTSGGGRGAGDTLARGRRCIAVDLKHPDGVATVLRLVERADGLLEGFRPGVMERLGLGPDVCLARNPRLVYGRMTGFGQTGPLAQAAGPRHQLHRAGRRARADRARAASRRRRRSTWWATSAAAA